MKRILLVLALVLFQGLDCTAGPKLFFSDLTDGVISGGHWGGIREGRGAAVSVWGRSLGSSRDTSKVTVCGVTLDADSDFAEWGATTEPIVPLEMQRITFFLNGSMQTGPGTIRVTTRDGDSNEIPFYCRDTGNIYFLDSAAGNDDYNGQYPTPQAGENGPKRLTAWARGNLEAGDVVYLKDGTYKDHDVGAMFHYGGLFAFGRDGGVPNHHSGTENQSIAVAAFPGGDVRLEATEACGAGTCLNTCIRMFYSGTQLDYWTFSKLTMVGAESAVQLGGTGYDNGGTKHIRLVNIDGTTIYAPQIRNGCIFSLYGSAKNMEEFKILGCYLHDQLANTRGQIWEDVNDEERAYQVYVGGYGTITNMEMGWNDMGWGSMGRGVQIYGHLPEDTIENLIVHNNWFHHNRRQAFILGGGDGGEEYAFVKSAYFYNNILSHSGWPVDESWCTILIGGVSWGRHGGDFYIYNNLIDGRSLAFPPINLTGFIDSLDLKNNMILAQPNPWGTIPTIRTARRIQLRPETICILAPTRAMYRNGIHPHPATKIQCWSSRTLKPGVIVCFNQTPQPSIPEQPCPPILLLTIFLVPIGHWMEMTPARPKWISGPSSLAGTSPKTIRTPHQTTMAVMATVAVVAMAAMVVS